MVNQRVETFKEVVELLEQGVVAGTVAVHVVLHDLPIVEGWSRIEIPDTFGQYGMDIHIGGYVSASITSHERVRSRMVNARQAYLSQRFLLDLLVGHPIRFIIELLLIEKVHLF